MFCAISTWVVLPTCFVRGSLPLILPSPSLCEFQIFHFWGSILFNKSMQLFS